MAFDQSTRNKLQRFVTDARILLTEEFSRQLQNEYGMDPDNGTVSRIDGLSHLTDAQHQTAKLLRETMAHYQAAGPGEDLKDILGRIVREQAFTVLNRLCALRMAEARGILMESIAKGYNSKGFQLYARVAGTSLDETGNAYRNYLFSIFDEFSVDLAVLFDRYSPMGRLFPKETALLALLEKINDPALESLWTEDETIGWIYQYFNSKEERKKMRDESQAPRNSRELAVRNQFFTPRYVVEFLTDNTLGRIWYELTKGNTLLKDQCRYLVRRPNEIFLEKGVKAPEQEDNDADLSQEELLNQPVYIEHRPMKDPREILMLDPACGSMHFGLYAFDLFEKIYEEAWDLQATGRWPGAHNENPGLLTEAYPTRGELVRDIPRLIIENNIHGVDIDPRAVQIAGLSLWLRAQRSWKAHDVKPDLRPQIRKSNIVCAEPMPGEQEYLKSFSEKMTPRVLGQLVEIIFEKMKLAGEAGSLLKIEEEIEEAVVQAREEFNKELLRRKEEAGYLPGFAPKVQQRSLFDFADLPDKTQFWQTAEEKIFAALKDYAEQAEEADGGRLRLFVEDAAKGFAFIGICRKRYDVVLMNPPFGEPSKVSLEYLKRLYSDSRLDIYASFIDRGLHLLVDSGFSRLGIISSRTGFFLSSLSHWRKRLLKLNAIETWIDQGFAVLDSGLDGAATYTIVKSKPICPSWIVSWLDVPPEKRDAQIGSVDEFSANGDRLILCNLAKFLKTPGSTLCYWIQDRAVDLLINGSKFKGDGRDIRQGMASGDNFRFIRSFWEVPPTFLHYPKRWVPYAKGGDYSPFYRDIELCIEWAKEGQQVKVMAADQYGSESRTIKSQDKYLKKGLTFTIYTKKGFNIRPLPAGCIFDVAGSSVFAEDTTESDLFYILGFFSSPVFQYFISALSDDRKWQVGILQNVPWSIPNKVVKTEIAENSVVTHNLAKQLAIWDETDHCHFAFNLNGLSISEMNDLINKERESSKSKINELRDRNTELICKSYRIDPYQLDRKPNFSKSSSLVRYHIDLGFTWSGIKETANYVLSHAFGNILGRWDIRYAAGKKQKPELTSSFEPLPVCPPGMLQNSEGLPAEPKDVPPDYPLRISWSGIIVDDEGDAEDIVTRIREALEVIWKDKANDIEQEACEIIGVGSLREYFGKPNKFFAEHLKRYSKSRRQAPIYWPLSTPSGSYTLWLYYHRLTDQTLYTCVNDIVGPRLKQISDDAEALRRKSNRTRQEEENLEKWTDLALELKDFQEELLRIAKFWKPNLNDGVQITAAPLWKLFQHKTWQKTLKQTWKDLEKGKYDWAHLAYSIWPERVIRASHKDRSYAIAHDLESDLWEEVEIGTDRKGNPKTKWAPKNLTEKELTHLIMQKRGNA